MSWGRDVRRKDLSMVPAPVAGGVEPQLLAPSRQAIRAAVAGRIDAYTPEWTDRRRDDAGVALVRAYGTVSESVNRRLNLAPRKLALEHLELAGVRALQARPARAVLAIEIAPRARAPVAVPTGSAFVVPGDGEPVVLETLEACQAIPGAIATVAVLADGWVVDDTPDALGGLAPFGPRPRVPGELWLGILSPIEPGSLLSVAVELLAPPGRTTASAIATAAPGGPPLLRWEALTSGGPVELAVERDGTAGLSQSGVLTLRVDAPAAWAPRTLPPRPDEQPLHWLRARLITNDYPDRRLARVTLNGVTAIAARSVRDEVLEPLGRAASGRSSYRLARVPVVAGSVLIDVTDTATDVFGAQDAGAPAWAEVSDLASAGPEDRVFALDPGAGIVTFGDGLAGRAVPDGFRNVVARRYAAGGGTAGLPAPGTSIAPERSTPSLDAATVLTITTGADAESADELVLRGPAELRSRGRAVAPADYATLALGTGGVEVARAHCLPGSDARSPGTTVPGVVGIVVVPATRTPGMPPTPSGEELRAVADHLAREVGVVGAQIVATAPRYREIAVQAVLVARAGSDLAAAGSAARDTIDGWLDPLHGFDGTGWPFGEAVRWGVLTRLLLARLADVTAVARLSFRIDGRRLEACADALLDPGELTWPGAHVVEVVPEERAS